MTYGLQSIALGPDAAIHGCGGDQASSATRRWRALDAERRLAIIEASLARSGVRDGYPLAL
jgi:hypothetical protein